MNIFKMSYSELLHTFREKNVIFETKDGRFIPAYVEEIEDETDGWDSFMFMITPQNPDDPIDIELNELKNIVLN